MKIGIIGCGMMGSAIAGGLKNHTLYVFDRNPEKCQRLAKSIGCNVAGTLNDLIKKSELIILAVKPQNLNEISKTAKKELKEKHTLISLLAGIPLKTLKEHFPKSTLIRLMPNLSVVCGEGVMGISDNDVLDAKTKDSLTNFLKPLGKVFWIPEKKMDGLTALAGSGPAFIFAIIEAMIDAGIAMGLSAKEARDLSYQMIKGSITLLEQTQKHPGEHKWEVTSPSGTTIAGLRRFENKGVRGGIIETFLAAYERAKELRNE